MYSFNDHPEHRAKLAPTAEKWTANALSTEPMTEADRDIATAAIGRLYEAASLPPPKKVVFVPSPLMGAVVAPIASAYHWLIARPEEQRALFGAALTPAALADAAASAAVAAMRSCQALYRAVAPLRDATQRAVDDATADATRDATYRATADATADATRDATASATERAVDDATADATRDATYRATADATADATRDATASATERAVDDAVDFFRRCIRFWWKSYNGGNFWSGGVSYLSFFRSVAQLPIDWSKWEPYETLAQFGPRFVHERFAIICDRPIEIHRDDRNRAHCVDGPHIFWRDGTEIYSIHGVRVPARYFSPDVSAQEIAAEPNAEVRRVLVERYCAGDTGRYFRDLGAHVIHADVDSAGLPRRLLRIDQLNDEPIIAVEVTNHSVEPDGSRKIYTFRCDPQLRPLAIPGVRSELGAPQAMTCQNAIASTYGFYGDQWTCASET